MIKRLLRTLLAMLPCGAAAIVAAMAGDTRAYWLFTAANFYIALAMTFRERNG
jgi:hypothetical protein